MSYMTDLGKRDIRSSSVLTNAYVAGTVIEEANKFNNLQLLLDFTKGSLTDCNVKVEISYDGTDYYVVGIDSISAGINTVKDGIILLDTTCKRTVSMPINTNYIKVSAIGNGTVTSSSLKITALVGVV